MILLVCFFASLFAKYSKSYGQILVKCSGNSYTGTRNKLLSLYDESDHCLDPGVSLMIFNIAFICKIEDIGPWQWYALSNFSFSIDPFP